MSFYFILIIIIFLFLYIYKIHLLESFVVPKNCNNIDTQNYKITNEFIYYKNILKQKYTNNIDSKDYIPIKNINSNLSSYLNNYIINELKYNIFDKISVKLSLPFENLKYKYKNDSELFLSFSSILSINNIQNYNKIMNFFATPVTIIIKITSKEKCFSLKKHNILNNYNSSLYFLVFDILDIEIIQQNNSFTKIPGFNTIDDNTYNITNNLHLLHPFTSSYDNMIVSEKMMQDFNKTIPQTLNAYQLKPYLNNSQNKKISQKDYIYNPNIDIGTGNIDFSIKGLANSLLY